MKKGFTLVEMLVVILIVSVLMMWVMNFGSGRMHQLQSKTAKERFISQIENTHTSLLSSNYYGDQRISQMDLSINPTDIEVVHTYNQQTYSEWLKWIEEINLIIGKKEIEDVIIQMKPYDIGCEIVSSDGTGSVLDIKMTTLWKREYCLELSADNCKIKQVICKDDEDL